MSHLQFWGGTGSQALELDCSGSEAHSAASEDHTFLPSLNAAPLLTPHSGLPLLRW